MKRRLHIELNQLVPSVANLVRNKQSLQKAAHDYHAKEREILEGQAVYAKDFRNKKAWMSGTVVEKTGPVSARVQLDDGRVIGIGTKTMFKAVRMMWRRSQRQVRHPT